MEDKGLQMTSFAWTKANCFSFSKRILKIQVYIRQTFLSLVQQLSAKTIIHAALFNRFWFHGPFGFVETPEHKIHKLSFKTIWGSQESVLYGRSAI